jgi:MoaA/NifB/PqqE/SkfB family radical SAM enzyme
MLAFRQVPMAAGPEAICRRCAGPEAHADSDAAATDSRLQEALSVEVDAGLFFTDTGALDLDGLVRLAGEAARSGASRIALRTSGRPVRDTQAAHALLQGGFRVLEVVFLGPGPEQHDALVGIPGGFDAAADAIAFVSEAATALGVRVALRGRIPVCRHNLKDAPATVMRLAELGVSSMVLACDPALDVRRSADWVAAACDTGTVNRVWVAVSGMPEPALGDKALHAVDVVSFVEALS